MTYIDIITKAKGRQSLSSLSRRSGVGVTTIHNWITGHSTPTMLNLTAFIVSCGYAGFKYTIKNGYELVPL